MTGVGSTAKVNVYDGDVLPANLLGSYSVPQNVSPTGGSIDDQPYAILATYTESQHESEWLSVELTDEGLPIGKQIAADAVVVIQGDVNNVNAAPGSWANREENFSGTLLHYADSIYKYAEVEVRIDGPLNQDVLGKKLTLTFDDSDNQIKVWDYRTGVIGEQISSGDDWDVTSEFDSFSIMIEGWEAGHTELVLSIEPDDGEDRPLSDKVFVIVNE